MLDLIHLIDVRIGPMLVGQIAQTPQRKIVFEYSPDFLKAGYSISPFYLPLKPGLFAAPDEPFAGNFGVFNDSLPDGWGNLLLDRFLMSQGISLSSLSVLDRLSLIGSNGMGALQYFPDQKIQSDFDASELAFLAREVRKVISETEYSEHIEMLIGAGGSPGGARPKALIKDNDESWMVKFPSSLDPPNIGSIEFEYSRIARKCGIEMPETQLFENKYFGVKRFDREGDTRIHMHTASGLLNASHRYPSLDYTDLMQASFALTKNITDSYKLFRQMVFNVLTGIKDDHAKNFSFLYLENGWRVAPAYDLAPSGGFNGNHTTTVAGQGQPSKSDIFEVGTQAGLKQSHLLQIFDEVYENCSAIRQRQW
ncbi:MAG: type II toxin-antitoxin system HipA family toxin [Candidatus Marinimicrobia bacterium]|jgi:serine/threonine-protein kinase HipA|nr:type II toxin-antitoxin system HipA family toxin [Candidatus Neomarinimicrobiota bacterium]